MMMQEACKKFYNVMQKVTVSIVKKYGTAQIASLQKAALKERCILVDRLDRSIGEATKEVCHEINTEGSIPLHRAFSVFLFNNKEELLIQKRSDCKITFPGHYTNTCCSHPLAEIPSEMIEENAIGIRNAAIRRLNYELGIPSEEIKPSELFYLTRIYYEAVSDNRWGEHEIDYVLFLKKDNITLDPNPDEISEIRWVSRSQIDNFVKTAKPLTPWFRLMYQHTLLHWWDNLHALNKMQDVDNIIALSN